MRQPDDSFSSGRGGEVFPKMTQMGRLRPLDRPFPGFSFFQRVTESVGLIFKSRLKRGTIFLWEVYEENASSKVVRVSKVSELNGNLMISNFLEHPRF